MTMKTVDPVRVTVATAAKMLDVRPNLVRRLVKAGLLTAIAPHGRGRGKPIYLIPDEVRLYATEGPAGLLRHRREKAAAGGGPEATAPGGAGE